jgi:hypothetical protein
VYEHEVVAGWIVSAPSDWVLQRVEDRATLHAPSGRLLIGFATFAPDAAGPSAAEWVGFVAHSAKVRGRRCEAVRIGAAEGVLTEFCVDDVAWRGWALRENETPLDITYRRAGPVVDAEELAAATIVQSLKRRLGAT